MVDQQRLIEAMKKSAAALRRADVPFILGGSMAAWARGGPRSIHDVDFMVKPEDAEHALEALTEAGMRDERPPEGWLFKAYDGDVLVDVIFSPSGMEITDEVFARADQLEVQAVSMYVMALEDVFFTKLAALREHELDYERLLEMARALREQIDWAVVRARAPDNPFVRAFFTIVEGLGIAPPPQPDAMQAAS
jgi:predicted nucleotidyltransferase